MKTRSAKASFIALMGAFPALVLAAPAGTLLFTKGDLKIVDPAGTVRVGKAGDQLQPGERVVTPDGAVCQIRLWDGSLVGVRPDTELKIDLPEKASDRAKNVIEVVKGALRVVNVDLRDGKTRVPVTLQSPSGVVDLTNADAESRVVSPEQLKKSGVKDTGLYTRLQIGTGTVKTGTTEVPIAVRTIAFTPTVDIAPTTLSSTSTTLFTTNSLLTTSLSTSTLDGGLTKTSTTTLDPKLTTSPSTATLEPVLTTSSLTKDYSTSPLDLSSATMDYSNVYSSPTITAYDTTRTSDSGASLLSAQTLVNASQTVTRTYDTVYKTSGSLALDSSKLLSSTAVIQPIVEESKGTTTEVLTIKTSGTLLTSTKPTTTTSSTSTTTTTTTTTTTISPIITTTTVSGKIGSTLTLR